MLFRGEDELCPLAYGYLTINWCPSASLVIYEWMLVYVGPRINNLCSTSDRS